MEPDVSPLAGRMAALEEIYALYDEAVKGVDAACRRGCDTCCTVNVTATTLEACHLLDDGAFGLPEAAADPAAPRFRPRLTTNELARRCLAGEPVPDEGGDPAWGSCPLLEDGACPVYPRRPFGCRCMHSAVTCRPGGEAAPDGFALALATVCIQAIEHLDRPGCSGNLADLLAAMADPALRDSYERGRPECRDLAPNRPLPAWMVPPEHRERMAPLVARLQAIIAPPAAG